MMNCSTVRPATPLTDSIKLVIQPCNLETGNHLKYLGFQPIPQVPQLLYRLMTPTQLVEVFLQISQMLSEASQVASRFCITRSPLDSKSLLVDFLDAQPITTITASVKHAWFLQVLAKQGLFFKYQPIFDLSAGEVMGYECLARAHNEEGRYFNGQQLVEAAVSTRLTREFDELARTTCFQAIAAMQTPHTFFINILPNAMIQDPHFPEQIWQQVRELGLQPQQIVLELTELEALAHTSQLSQVISQIHRWGFRFAVDDLCGSVSSEHYFMDFRPDVIKIDKRLIAGCSRYPLKQILIKSLLHSAHEMDIQVLAEGLEQIEDIDFCRDLGIDYGQGFGLALPDRTPQSRSLNWLDLSSVS